MLEEKFKNTLNYIELDWQNAGTFSNEYALLLQSIGAELDNFFKVYCGFAAEDRKNMNDYCTFVLSDYSDIVNQKILIPERDMEFLPYQGWSAANPAQSLTFWNGMDRLVEDYVGDKIPLWEKIMDRQGTVCCAWEKIAFEEGLKVGIRLMMEAYSL